jgi:hypothetical protein
VASADAAARDDVNHADAVKHGRGRYRAATTTPATYTAPRLEPHDLPRH